MVIPRVVGNYIFLSECARRDARPERMLVYRQHCIPLAGCRLCRRRRRLRRRRQRICLFVVIYNHLAGNVTGNAIHKRVSLVPFLGVSPHRMRVLAVCVECGRNQRPVACAAAASPFMRGERVRTHISRFEFSSFEFTMRVPMDTGDKDASVIRRLERISEFGCYRCAETLAYIRLRM